MNNIPNPSPAKALEKLAQNLIHADLGLINQMHSSQSALRCTIERPNDVDNRIKTFLKKSFDLQSIITIIAFVRTFYVQTIAFGIVMG